MQNDQWKTASVPLGVSVSWDPKEARQNYAYLGEQFTGTYVSVERNVGENKSNVYKLNLEDGRLVSLWGSTLIDDKFEKGNDGSPIPEGALVRVTNEGMKDSQRGGRTYRVVKVEFHVPATKFKTAGEESSSPKDDDSGY